MNGTGSTLLFQDGWTNSMSGTYTYDLTNTADSKVETLRSASTDVFVLGIEPYYSYNSGYDACLSIYGYSHTDRPYLSITYVENPTWDGSSSSDWVTAANWSTNSVPSSSTSVTIADVATQPLISSAVTVASLTINANADLTISSNSLTVTGATDVDGTLNVGNATVNLDGSADFTNGTIDFTNDNGKIICSSTVTSMGTVDASMGTIEYDGASSTVHSNTYNNLTISTAGIKQAGGNITVNGDLSTANTTGCVLDMHTYDLTAKGGISVGSRGGLDLSDASCDLTLSGSNAQSISHQGSYNYGSNTPITTEQVSSGSDDALEYETPNTVGNNFTNMRLGNRSGGSYGDCLSGIRFTSVPVAQGVDIVSASIQVSSFGNETPEIFTKIYAEDIDDATAFSNTTANLSGRTLTTASVDWDVSTSWTDGSWYTSVDISSVIQEIVDRGGWSSGNDINILIKDDGSASGNNRNIYTYDYNPSYAPKLDITYRTRTNTNGLFKNLTLNNSAGMTLSSDVEIEGTLTLTSGNITTGSNTLTIASGGTISRAGGKGCECVVGNLAKEHSSTTAVTYEVGDGTRYRPLVIAPASASSETYTVKYNNTQYTTTTCSDDGPGGTLDHIASSYYDISRANSVNANISIEWYSTDQVDDVSSIRLCHFNTGDNKWDALTTSTKMLEVLVVRSTYIRKSNSNSNIF